MEVTCHDIITILSKADVCKLSATKEELDIFSSFFDNLKYYCENNLNGGTSAIKVDITTLQKAAEALEQINHLKARDIELDEHISYAVDRLIDAVNTFTHIISSLNLSLNS